MGQALFPAQQSRDEPDRAEEGSGKATHTLSKTSPAFPTALAAALTELLQASRPRRPSSGLLPCSHPPEPTAAGARVPLRKRGSRAARSPGDIAQETITYCRPPVMSTRGGVGGSGGEKKSGLGS
ncbi:hypothetical protein CVT26_007477 [Gymnopilus dilepis]|uniref:Uncharacterized protein n=1 Tax=Gymnopilus dilepis TaxID=231916 RepID=A0A409WWH1_9AGAR|nr:hypothetical protein CVT26_007477 [Gymnopilus dilepis]